MKILIVFTILIFSIELFVILAHPLYRGKEMVQELKSDCDKRGGVMLIHTKTFVIEYQCVSRLDNK